MSVVEAIRNLSPFNGNKVRNIERGIQGLSQVEIEKVKQTSFDFFRENFRYDQNPEWQSVGFRNKRYCSDDDWIFTGSGEIWHGYEGLLPKYKGITAVEWLSEKCLQIRDRKVRVLESKKGCCLVLLDYFSATPLGLNTVNLAGFQKLSFLHSSRGV